MQLHAVAEHGRQHTGRDIGQFELGQYRLGQIIVGWLNIELNRVGQRRGWQQQPHHRQRIG